MKAIKRIIRGDRYFKASLIAHNDEELRNTFPVHIGFIIIAISIVLVEAEWNLISILAIIVINSDLSLIFYRFGYKDKENMAKKIQKI